MTTLVPRPFQQEAIDKLSKPKIVSRLIGDEMGLGKTVTALFLDKRNREDRVDLERYLKRTLIVCPLAVVESWVRHIKWLHGDDARVVSINPKNRGAFVAALKEKHEFYVIHWEGMRLLRKELASRRWFHIIADEAHRAKNRKAQQTLALKMIPTLYKTACSGTPADDKPHDIWSVLNWLWPQVYTSYWKFLNHHCIFETQGDIYGQGRTYRKFVGVQNAQSLQKQMEPWFVRRFKKDVYSELPDKYYTTIWVDLDPKQRRAYNQMRDEMIAWLEDQDQNEPVVAPVVIAQLTRLQQFALGYMEMGEDGKWRISDPSTKLDALMQLVEDNEGKQLVVFSQFKSILYLAKQRLDKKKITCGLYTGDQNKQERDALVDYFQAGKTMVFLGSIAAGGEGITLTAADTCVFLDRSWKPTKNLQAEDRLHRMGQENAVQIIDLMARDTIDPDRKYKIELKWNHLKAILGDDLKTNSTLTALTEDPSWVLG